MTPLEQELVESRERLRQHLRPIEDAVFERVWGLMYASGEEVQSLWLLIENDELIITTLLDAFRKLAQNDEEGALQDWAIARHLRMVSAAEKARVFEQRDRAVLEGWS